MKPIAKIALAGVIGGLIVAGLWLSVPAFAERSAVEVTAEGGGVYHVFPPEDGFTVTVTATVVSGPVPETLAYQWVDFRGRPLSQPASLTLDRPQRIPSPSEHMTVGYYGLLLLPSEGVDFNPASGARREIGFAVLPKAEPRRPDPDSRFGLVHFDDRDPYLDPGWMKTTTEVQAGWDGKDIDAAAWQALLSDRRAAGQIELPLIMGDTWKSGSPDQIRRLMAALFAADPGSAEVPAVPAYELGLEENLGPGDYRAKLAETAEKFRAAQEEKARLAPSVKLAYQVAGTDIGPYRALFESPLARRIDILAAHPYPWHGWPTPDAWHDKFLDDIRAAMAANGLDIPIWYTEAGAVQNDANVPVIFSGAKPTGHGLSRANYAAYLVKLHAHAFAKGVSKVFWYNYRDRTISTTDAEAHFGLRDYWGYPKPGYLAYAATLRCMKHRTPSPITTRDGIVTYRFHGQDSDCIVAWASSDTIRPVGLDELGVKSGVAEAFDLVGTPIDVSTSSIDIGSYPVFLIAQP